MSLHRFENKNRRGESGRSLNTYQSQNTAYDRAFSSKSILTQMIPGFLIQNNPKEGLSSLDLLRLNLSKKPETPQPSLDLNNSPVKLRENESPHNRLKISTEKLNAAKQIEKITHSIYNPTLPPNEIMLKFNKKSLSRSDLLCFREGSELPDIVIDCYMSILKLTNRVNSSQNTEKFIIFNTNYSKALFKNKKMNVPPNQNIFENKFLVVPMFDGYWTLIVVNLQTGVTNFYDGLMPDRQIQTLLNILGRFLVASNNAGGIDEDFLKFQKPKIPAQIMSLKDSGVFICKVAEALVQNREIKQFDFRTCRKDMLNNLIRISLKVM